METLTAAYWVSHLGLQPHPEGGYYKETFRSKQEVKRSGAETIKQACTSIYYLLEGEDFSGFHRIQSDEIWYFHKGVPLHVHVITPDGLYILHQLSDLPDGHLSVVVPAGCWFAAELPSKQDFVLVSCAVAPAFDFSEFEMGDRAELLAAYPQHSEVIERLCR